MRGAIVSTLGLAILCGMNTGTESPCRMSFHNRLLWNRAVVAGLHSIDVMLAVRSHAIAETAARVERLGGRVRRADDAVGYLRVEVPIETLLELVASIDVEAYQISSMSRGTWYRDAQPQRNADVFRGFEVAPPQGERPSGGANPDLPALSVGASRESGFTADDDAGVGRWMAEHPTFDGRGVTIALLESAQPAFNNPTLRSAKTLDGRDVPKIAGILNVVAPDVWDETRVALETEVRVAGSWCQIGGRTYVFPHAGVYRFGVFRIPGGANVVHEFGVVEDLATHEIWIDANGDADFQDERPLTDVNEGFDVRTLKLRAPRPEEVTFVMARGSAPHTVHIYTGTTDHQTMTASVAAGSRTADSLAYGVAPNARILLGRTSLVHDSLVSLVEAYLEAAKRSDVDVLDDSATPMLVPDTSADFLGVLFWRLAAVYGKPIVQGASNMQLFMNSASAIGSFSVGGVIGPKTFAAFYGGSPLDRLIVHPVGGAGPSLDGAIKPDFLAPFHRIAADLPWNELADPLPRNAPAARLPPGYMVSCCTSASSPYAAGMIALLISAARQEHVPYTLESLGRALRLGARFLPGVPSYEQGNGVLDVEAAWRELRRPASSIPGIVAGADVVHPLAQYAADGPRGGGIFEFEGWSTGMTGRRDVRLRRESGPSGPVLYGVSWTGNDGTFSVPPAVELPLNATIALPVTIAVRATGAHSAILNLHDWSTGAIVFRTQATIVAAERFDVSAGAVRIGGVLPLLRQQAHYIQVPPATESIAIELDVMRGTVGVAILPSHGLFLNYYQHVFPYLRRFPPGKYAVVLPNPAAGPWTISMRNDSALMESDRAIVSTVEADYAITVRLMRASLRAVAADRDTVSLEFENQASPLRAPLLDTSIGTLASHRSRFLATGFPNAFEITVPEGSETLWLRARPGERAGVPLELYLYDCTSGECFSHNLAFPAANTQTLVVRKPKAGRWIAAVNAAPFPAADGEFVLDEIITLGAPRRSPVSSGPESLRTRWTQGIDTTGPPIPGKTRILFFELVDAAIEREIANQPWETRQPAYPMLPGQVVAGTAIYRIE
jgi:Subtilase family